MSDARPHLPRQVPIESYGNGGFRFGDMSHRGSILCLPSGVWRWDIDPAQAIDRAALEPIFAESEQIDMLLIGSGFSISPLPADVRAALRDHHIGTEVMATGTAIRTYNIVLGEGRRVAAALIAVD